MIRPSSIMWCNMVSAAEVVELFHIRWRGHLRTFKLGPKMSSHVILAQRGKSPPPAGPLSDDVTWLWCFFHVNYLVKCQKCHHVILTQVSAWYDCLWSILIFSGIVRYSKACVCGWAEGGGGITCDHCGVRELTDFGNLSTVNQKPVTFVIGTNNMPHEGEYITSYNCY